MHRNMFRKIISRLLINKKYKISLLRPPPPSSSSPSAIIKSPSSNTVPFYLIIVLLSHIVIGPVESVFLESDGSRSSSLVSLHPDGGGGGFLESSNNLNLNLEKSIAAVFNRVAYGSTTTTKRSIPDNVYVPSLTTVPTPLLTTFRYREKDKESASTNYNENSQRVSEQQAITHSRNYELDLERDHALPTSAPNADILKSNNNPTYPNPNRHHNHDRHRHPNSTPYPSAHPRKGVPTNAMFSGDMPSYSPPSRAFFTPPLPPNITNPFAETPTLRGTNSDGTVINTASFVNRRPVPPPSLMPGHERIPFRPPDLGPGSGNQMSRPSNIGERSPPSRSSSQQTAPQFGEIQRKKALNTPSGKFNKAGIYTSSNNKLFLLESNNSDILPNGMHFPSISRILSGSNGRKQSIPDVLLRAVTIPPPRPIQQNVESNPFPAQNENNNMKNKENNKKNVDEESDDDFDLFEETRDNRQDQDGNNDGDDDDDDTAEDDNVDDDGSSLYSTQLMSNPNKVTTTLAPSILSSSSSSIIQTMANVNIKATMVKTNSSIGNKINNNDEHLDEIVEDLSTWTIAWNIHVYLSAILFTILAVYSIFKMIFYDKLTHLFSQSYFISIHIILIVICLLRIFYLCYDAYNIHFSFTLFLSEILLNIPLTLLTITFSILILFLLVRSINHKANRYSSIIRPMTIIIGSVVHVGLCLTLHYVESIETQQYFYKQQQFQQNKMLLMTTRNPIGNGAAAKQQTIININIPPRVLSLICQIIYIFICLSLGILYLYIYRLLKRILNKSQNYIHGYNNLSYAIHITIATALLFIVLAALQIYGAISISAQTKIRINLGSVNDGAGGKRTLFMSHIDIDWLQWGYQFSLRFLEIVIISLIAWVTGLKTGTSKVVQREKGFEQQNVSGFALFPCTSSSSQEHFEADYPAVCNANTNLHTYTLRTGKPIYDDNFALNSLNLEQNGAQEGELNDFQRSHESNSIRSSSQTTSNNNSNIAPGDNLNGDPDDCLNDSGACPDHYENPNFVLRQPHKQHVIVVSNHSHNQIQDLVLDNCYSEPMNVPTYDTKGRRLQNNPRVNYDFQNFERPSYDPSQAGGSSRNEFRASKNLKALKNSSNYAGENIDKARNTINHQHFNQYNNNYNDSFERKIGVRKSGTLNNIGGVHYNHRNNSASSNSSMSSNNGVNMMQNSRKHAQTFARPPNDHHHQHQHQHRHPPQNAHFPRNTTARLSNNQRNHNSPTSPQDVINNFDDEYHYHSSGSSSAANNHDNINNMRTVSPTLSASGQIETQLPIQQPQVAVDGTMIVAEHGFVRFRALDDMQHPQNSRNNLRETKAFINNS